MTEQPTNARCRAPDCTWAITAKTEAGAIRELQRHHDDRHPRKAKT
jgi:predicted small metal-binding protein